MEQIKKTDQLDQLNNADSVSCWRLPASLTRFSFVTLAELRVKRQLNRFPWSKLNKTLSVGNTEARIIYYTKYVVIFKMYSAFKTDR